MPPVSGVTSRALKAFTSGSAGIPGPAGHWDRRYSSPPALATANMVTIEVLIPGRAPARTNSTTARRMNVALTWLNENDVPLAEVAGRLGYESEAAFRRTFKRVIGFSPGAVRRTGAAASSRSN